MTGQRATMGPMDTRTPPKAATAAWVDMLRAHGVDPDAVEQAPPAAGNPETPEDRAARLALQAGNRAARWVRRLPVMYRQASLDDLGEDQHRQTLVDWLDDASATLVLAGSVGTGKTHAAYAVGHAAVAQGVWVEAWTLADLLEALRPGGDPEALDAVRSCGLLLLDDLSVGKVSDWAVEQVTSLLDHRLRMGLRQVVTTNLPHGDLLEAWGARVMDRLAYRWTVLQFVGESRRRAAW